MVKLFKSREDWLKAMLVILRRDFKKNGYAIGKNVRVSCGFPVGGRKRIGECHSDTVSKDHTFEIFVSPTIEKEARVTDILVHELCHVAVGLDKGHKAEFKHCALKMGLAGKMTSTVPGPELLERILKYVKKVGKYPHAEMAYMNVKKQSTRLIKCECPECGYTVRIAQSWIGTGMPKCPECVDENEEPLEFIVSPPKSKKAK